MAKQTTDYTGNVQAAMGPMLLRIALEFASQSEPIAQLVENGADAITWFHRHRYTSLTQTDRTQGKVWVVLRGNGADKGQIHVIDNGSGMVPYMEPHHYSSLLQYLSGSGTLDDLESSISEESPSRSAAQRMIEAKALSLKDVGAIGAQGLGVVGVWAIGEDITCFTRPHPKLAKSVGLPLDSDGHAATFAVMFPTRTDLRNNQLSYAMTEDGIKPLVDPWGKELAHGTHIVISGVDLSMMRSPRRGFTPAVLVKHLSERFALLRQMGIDIQVIDRVTDKARGKPGGEEVYLVQEPAFPKIPLYQEQDPTALGGKTATKWYHFTHGGEEKRFQVCLYYTEKVQAPVGIVREGSRVCDVNALGELGDFPGSGHVTGYIWIPMNASQTEFPSRTVGKIPDESNPAVQAWMAVIRKYVYPKIERFLEERRSPGDEGQRRARIVASLNDKLNAALQKTGSDAVTFLPESGERVEVGQEKAATKGKTSQDPESKSPYVPKVVYAQVYGRESRKGLGGVEVQLQVGRNIERRNTNANGYVNFGPRPHSTKQTPGKKPQTIQYTMRVVVPQGMQKHGTTDRPFTLSESQPGAERIFYIFTGEEMPKTQTRGRKRTVELRLSPIEEEQLPYQVAVGAGIVFINSRFLYEGKRPVEEAMSLALKGKPELLNQLLATLAVDGITHLLLALGYPPNEALPMASQIRMNIMQELGLLG